MALLGTLTKNVAQAPRDEKFRRVRLTNPKIAAALVDVKGAVDVMLHLGWVHVRATRPVDEICQPRLPHVSSAHGVARTCTKHRNSPVVRMDFTPAHPWLLNGGKA